MKRERIRVECENWQVTTTSTEREASEVKSDWIINEILIIIHNSCECAIQRSL